MNNFIEFMTLYAKSSLILWENKAGFPRERRINKKGFPLTIAHFFSYL